MKIAGLFGLLWVGFALFCIGAGFYGLYLAFSASIILGIIVLILEPSPFIIGLIAIFGRPDICEQIAKWLGLA